MRGALAIAGHFAFCILGYYLGYTNRQAISVGSSQAAFVGLFFIYWAVVLIIAFRSKADDFLFRLIRKSESSLMLAVIFLLGGVALVIVGLWPV